MGFEPMILQGRGGHSAAPCRVSMTTTKSGLRKMRLSLGAQALDAGGLKIGDKIALYVGTGPDRGWLRVVKHTTEDTPIKLSAATKSKPTGVLLFTWPHEVTSFRSQSATFHPVKVDGKVVGIGICLPAGALPKERATTLPESDLPPPLRSVR